MEEGIEWKESTTTTLLINFVEKSKGYTSSEAITTKDTRIVDSSAVSVCQPRSRSDGFENSYIVTSVSSRS